jgi:predicted ribosomally synthesized peptide with SipW-like signal peptide
VGTAGILVAGATFALFTSQAQAQADSFQAGTVILTGQPATCTFANMEPGDSDTCMYDVTYKGSLDAWITLSVSAMSTAMQAYTPMPGSQTMIGGQALLNNQSPNGLQLSITDNQGPNTTPEQFQLGALSCSNIGKSGTSLGQIGYQDRCTAAPTQQLVTGQGPLAVSGCQLTNSCVTVGGNGSVEQGWTDTFTVTGTLPLAAGNIYQGANAVVTLQAMAQQASNNNSVPTNQPSGLPTALSFVSNSTWPTYSGRPSMGGKLLGNAEDVCLSATVPYACPAGGVIFGYPTPNGVWTAPLTNIPGALWIWAPGVTGSTPTTTDQTVYFSKDLYIPAPVVTGTVTIYAAADNYAAVYINGNLVGQVGVYGQTSSGTYNSINTITVPGSDFTTGLNRITVEGSNTPNKYSSVYQGNPAGVVFGGTLQLA